VVGYEWALASSVVVALSQRFRYTFGPISREDLMRFGSEGTYMTTFRFVTVACGG